MANQTIRGEQKIEKKMAKFTHALILLQVVVYQFLLLTDPGS